MKVLLERSIEPPFSYLSEAEDKSQLQMDTLYINCEHCQTSHLHVILCEYMIHCTQSKAMNPISNQELLVVIFYGWKFMRASIHFVS